MTDRQVEGVNLDELEEFYKKFEDAVTAAIAAAMRASIKDGAIDAGSVAAVSLDDLNVIPGQWARQVPALAEDLAGIYVKSADMQADAFVRAGGVVTDEIAEAVQSEVAKAVRRFTSEHEAAVDYLRMASNRLVGIGDDLWADARAELLLGMDAGDSVPQLARRVREATGVTGKRALVIARSEAVAASNGGSIAFMRSTGMVATKAWKAHVDERTRESHRIADGQEVDLNARFVVGGALLDHPGDPVGPPAQTVQCFPADTLVSFPSIRSVTRRWYEGDFVRVRFASGNELSGTPNHPVLGAFGWVPLGEVKEGDDLVNARLGDMGVAAPDVENPPTEIGEVYRAAQLASIGAQRVGVTPLDFHGDGAYGEVDVVSVDGALRFDGEPASEQEIVQFGLALADLARLSFGQSDGLLVSSASPKVGFDANSNTVVCSPGPISALGGSHLGHAYEVGFATVSGSDSSFDKSPPDSGSPELGGLGYGEFAHAVEVHLDDAQVLVGEGFRARPVEWSRLDAGFLETAPCGRGVASEFGGDLVVTGPLGVSLDHVVDVERYAWSGHVFNLDTGHGWYTAAGVPARNCRCVMLYGLTPDAADLAQGGDTLAASAQEDAVTVTEELQENSNPELELEFATLVAAMDPMNSAPWEGVICVTGTPTGDRRQFDNLTWADLPLPLRRNVVESHGGVPQTQAVLVGRIDTIEMRANEVWASGVIDLGSDAGRETARLMGTRDNPGFLRGVSIDGDEQPGSPSTIEYVFPADCAQLAMADGEPSMDDMARCMEPELSIWSSARIRGATLTDIAALTQANLYLTDTGMDEEMDETAAQLAAPAVASVTDIHEPTMADVVESLTAAAATIVIPDLPLAWWFDEPTDAPEIGAIEITAEGRLFGLLAPGGVAHRGMKKRTLAPTRNVDYTRWMNRATIVDNQDGTTGRVASGPITMNCGHVSPTGRMARDAAATMETYDNSCSIFATACVGEDGRGNVWIAGAVLPDVTPSMVARALACQLSGDWRPHRDRQGWRELCGALLVPVPGFPVANRGARVSMQGDALVASAVPVRFAGDTECESCGDDEVMVASVDSANAAMLIAASVGRDHATRARDLYRSVNA